MTELIIGIIMGLVISNMVIRRCSDGVMVVDDTNPNKIIYRLELNELECLTEQKRIILKVDSKSL